MVAKKTKIESEQTLFYELAQEIGKDLQPVDLKSKVLTYDCKRTSKREAINGSATVYNLREKILSKASLKDLSPTGARFEIWPCEIKAEGDVYVQFNGALKLGMVLCTVQWVTDIPGHRQRHKLVGLKFKSLTPLKLKQLMTYLDNVQNSRDGDPFYFG